MQNTGYQKQYTPKPPELGKGRLTANKKKSRPSDPDFRGQLNVDGNIVMIMAWSNTSEYGPYINLAVSKPRPETVEVKDNFDGDIPF